MKRAWAAAVVLSSPPEQITMHLSMVAPAKVRERHPCEFFCIICRPIVTRQRTTETLGRKLDAAPWRQFPRLIVADRSSSLREKDCFASETNDTRLPRHN